MPSEPILNGIPFDRATAADHGVSQERMRRLLAVGALRQVLRGVYVDASVPDDLALRVACLRLRLPAGAAVSRLTAVWLRGVDGRDPGRRGEPKVVECTVPPGREPMSRPGVRCFVAPLGADDVELVGDLPCTTSLRTTVDLLRWLTPPMALAVADAMAARGLVAAAALPAAVERFAGAPHVARARYLAAVVEPLTESFGESWLRLRMIDAGFPRPTAQIVVPHAGGAGWYRLDLGWPEVRVAVEYDGEEHHASAGQRAHDERRREHLGQLGWTALGVGKGEVLGSSMLLERTVGGLLGREPAIGRRRW